MALSRENKRSITAKLILLLTAAIWGSAFVVLKDAISDVPTFFVLAFRFLLGAATLALLFFKSFKRFSLKVLLKGSLTGVAVAAAYALQTIGLEHTTPGINAFLTAVYCVITPFMMWAITRRRPSVFRFAAAAVCFAGIGLVSVGSIGGFTFMGEGLTLIAGLFFALQIVMIDRLLAGEDAMLFTIWELFSCGVIMAVVYLATEADEPLILDGGAWWRLIYLAVVATAGALGMMTFGVKYSSSVAGALIMSLESVFGVAFSLIFGYESATAQTAIGFAVIFVAIVIGEAGEPLAARLREKRKKPGAETSAGSNTAPAPNGGNDSGAG